MSLELCTATVCTFFCGTGCAQRLNLKERCLYCVQAKVLPSPASTTQAVLSTLVRLTKKHTNAQVSARPLLTHSSTDLRPVQGTLTWRADMKSIGNAVSSRTECVRPATCLK